jgi:hypothetical protein
MVENFLTKTVVIHAPTVASFDYQITFFVVSPDLAPSGLRALLLENLKQRMRKVKFKFFDQNRGNTCSNGGLV